MRTITEEQIQTIINQLAEAPAKYVYNSISLLQSLPKQEELIIPTKKK